MAKIYRVTDRIKIKIGDISFELSPLTSLQKADIMSKAMSNGANGLVDSTKLALKYAIKRVNGLETLDDVPYQVELENGVLSDTSVDDLLNIEITDKLQKVCLNLMHGIPEKFLDPETGMPVEGVEVIKKDNGGVEEKK